MYKKFVIFKITNFLYMVFQKILLHTSEAFFYMVFQNKSFSNVKTTNPFALRDVQEIQSVIQQQYKEIPIQTHQIERTLNLQTKIFESTFLF